MWLTYGAEWQAHRYPYLSVVLLGYSAPPHLMGRMLLLYLEKLGLPHAFGLWPARRPLNEALMEIFGLVELQA